jgi:hypothetical protein
VESRGTIVGFVEVPPVLAVDLFKSCISQTVFDEVVPVTSTFMITIVLVEEP